MQSGPEYSNSPSTESNQGAERSTPWLQLNTSPPASEYSSLKPTMQRRAKRIVPDEDKDQKYWEKRKRNNLAAKRSRENKRQEEMAKQLKLHKLMEDNAVLSHELMLLKHRYRLPLNQCLLTPTQRAQCIQEVRAALSTLSVAESQGANTSCATDDYLLSPSMGPVSLFPTSRPSGKILHGSGPPGLCVIDESGDASDPSGGFNSHGVGYLQMKHEQFPLSYQGTESFLPRVSEYKAAQNVPTPTSLWDLHGGWHGVNQTHDYSMELNHHHQQQQQQQQHQQQQQQQEQYHLPQQHHKHQEQQQYQQASFGSYSTTSPLKLPSITSAFPAKTTATGGHSRCRYQVTLPAANTNTNISIDNNINCAASTKTSGTTLNPKEVTSSFNYYRGRQAEYSSADPPNSTTTSLSTLPTASGAVPAGALARTSRSLLQPAPTLQGKDAGIYLKSSQPEVSISGTDTLSSPSTSAHPIPVSITDALATLQASTQLPASTLASSSHSEPHQLSGPSAHLSGGEVSVSNLLPPYAEGLMC